MSASRRLGITEKMKDQFLACIADGKTRQEAAEICGVTATKFRTLINGKSEESLAFAKRYMEVLEEVGSAPSPMAARIKELEGVQLAHRLFDEFLVRALDAERGKVGSSNRMLYQLSLLSVESFKPLLEARTRHIHEGAVGIYAMPQLDTSKWTIEQHDRFLELERERQSLIAIAQPEDPRRTAPKHSYEIGAAEEAEIVDSEAVEVA